MFDMQYGIPGIAVQKSAPAAVTAMYTAVTQSLVKTPLGRVVPAVAYSAYWPDLKKKFFSPKSKFHRVKMCASYSRVA